MKLLCKHTDWCGKYFIQVARVHRELWPQWCSIEDTRKKEIVLKLKHELKVKGKYQACCTLTFAAQRCKIRFCCRSKYSSSNSSNWRELRALHDSLSYDVIREVNIVLSTEVVCSSDIVKDFHTSVRSPFLYKGVTGLNSQATTGVRPRGHRTQIGNCSWFLWSHTGRAVPRRCSFLEEDA